MSISFSEIPADNLVPIFATEFDGSNATKSGAMPWKNLIIGQPLSSKMSSNGTLTRITSDEQADATFGYGSQLALMIKAFRKNTKNSELWALPVADVASAAAAKGSVEFAVSSGKQNKDGEEILVVSGAIRFMVAGQACAVNVSADDTAKDIASKVVEAVNAKENLPVTAAVSSGDESKVELTAKNSGSNGNGIDIRWNHNQGEFLPEGLSIVKVDMANGGADPSYADALVKATCEGTWFNTIVIGSDEPDNVNYIKEMLDERWKATVQQTGVLFFSLNAGQTSDKKPRIPELTDFIGRGEVTDSKAIVLAALPKSPTTGYEKASALLGCVAPKALNDPARPLSNWGVAGVVAPKPEDREGMEGNNALLKAGCALMVSSDDGSVYTKRIVTTYKKNAAGAKDTAYMQLETVMTLSYLRWDWNNYLAVKYPNAKLADDGNKFGAGQVVMTPELGKAELLSRYQLWMEKGLVQNYEDFAANLVVALDPDDPYAMQFLIPAHLIKQFFVGKSKIQFD